MNYHLMIDDKFIDGFIDSAEKVAPGKNIYIFTFNPPAKYVKSTSGIFAPFYSTKLKGIVKNITIDDKVFIHWFTDKVMKVFDEIDVSVPVYLFFWGGDFLEQSNSFYDFNYDSLTKRYIRNKSMFYWTLNPFNYLRIGRDYFFFNYRNNKKRKIEFENRKRFLNRLTCFCHWNYLDFLILKEVYCCSPRYLDFFYAPLPKFDFGKMNKKSECTPFVIWLGNSDTETNNHLDAINDLKNFSNFNIKVVCPLNYGNIRYGDFVTKKGRLVFNTKWISLRDFLPINSYLKILFDADVMVMYHNRTQGVGNVVTFIYMGKKVYLKKKSTVYQLLRSLDIEVGDTSTIANGSFEEFSRPLTKDQIHSNITKLSDYFSDEKHYEYLSRILN